MYILILILFSNYCLAQEFYPQEDNLGVSGAFGFTEFGGGGGISFVDFNQDGLDDLTFGTEANAEIIFYENKGDHFELVSPPFVSVLEETKQLVWVDYDKDGDQDFFVTSFNGENYLFENDGNMNFTDVTDVRGLANDEADTYSANFADLDKDGWLDLYIARYGEDIIGDTNSLYRYNPQANSYTNVTTQSGTSNGFRESLATAFFDFDLDGDLDLYVSNDRVAFENSLYMNLGNMVFVDVSVPSLTNATVDAMNAGVADYDNDGFFDIYITHTNTSVMYHNNGDNTFTDLATSSNTEMNRYSWCGTFFDFDNDEDEDLYVNTVSLGPTSPNAFFVNQNDGTFTEPLYTTGGLAGMDTLESFTNVVGDFNNDGRYDIAVSKDTGFDFTVFSNNEENDNNFIKVKLKGTDSNVDAYGALIEVWNNGNKRIFQKHSTVGYQSQHSNDMIFGLGQNTTLDSLVIKWPYPNSKSVILGSDLLVNGTNEIEENSNIVNSYTTPLCLYTQEVTVSPVPSHNYGAEQVLNSGSIILDGSGVLFQSQVEISLEVGFEVEAGAEFEAEINVCGN